MEKTIELDGSGWKDVFSFLVSLRAAVGAPDWHGSSPDAFIDSMIYGGINALNPPYTIVVSGLEQAPEEVVAYVDLISRVLADADEERFADKGDRVRARVVRRTA